MTNVQSLIDQFTKAAKPIEKRASLTFRTSNQVLFEIEINCQGDQAFGDEVLGIVQQAVTAAVSNLK